MWNSLTKFALAGQRGNNAIVSKRMIHQMTVQHHGSTYPTWRTASAPRPHCPREMDDLLDGILARCTPVVHKIPHNMDSLDAWKSITNDVPLGDGEWHLDTTLFQPEEISCMNRNARRPNKANHGARPCSRSSRRWKKEKIGKRRRG